MFLINNSKLSQLSSYVYIKTINGTHHWYHRVSNNTHSISTFTAKPSHTFPFGCNLNASYTKSTRTDLYIKRAALSCRTTYIHIRDPSQMLSHNVAWWNQRHPKQQQQQQRD